MGGKFFNLIVTIFLVLTCCNFVLAQTEVYFVPYMGDINGYEDQEWFDNLYRKLINWHDSNSIPIGLSFYPENIDTEFSTVLDEMYGSENIELILKGEDQYQGTNMEDMTVEEAKEALQYWQDEFINEMGNNGYSVEPLVSYNQLYARFTESIRDAARDLGFKIYFEQYTDSGYIEILPDFDIIQYSVSLTESGLPGPEETYKQPLSVIQEVIDFDHSHLLYIDGIKVVPLLTHQQDFKISYDSNQLDEDKWQIYTTLLTMAKNDPRIEMLLPEHVYDLRHDISHFVCGNNIRELGEECDGSDLDGNTCVSLGFDSGTLTCSNCIFDTSSCEDNQNYFFTDFETDNGWSALGSGQGKFEIGTPSSFSASGGECRTYCLGTGTSEDHTDSGTKAACTNLDGHMKTFESETTNSLVSPIYDLSDKSNVNLELWRFMEIEGNNYDFCYYQYKDSSQGSWINLETYGSSYIDDNSWKKYSKDISNLADNKPYFQLRFYCTTDNWYEGSGMCLDDIKISYDQEILCEDEETRQCETSNVGACEFGTQTCSGGVWQECIGNIEPSPDNNCNNIDDDCDGLLDDDYQTTSTNCGVGACSDTGLLECINGVETNSCVPGIPISNDDSTCDGIDDDCDDSVDEDCEITSLCQFASDASADVENIGSRAIYATGAPDAPKQGDCDGWFSWSGFGVTWSPPNWNTKGTLTLKYNTLVYVSSFTIFGDYDMCWNKMWLKNSVTQEQKQVFNGYDNTCTYSKEEDETFLADTIILETCGWSWSSTDAVELCGRA